MYCKWLASKPPTHTSTYAFYSNMTFRTASFDIVRHDKTDHTDTKSTLLANKVHVNSFKQRAKEVMKWRGSMCPRFFKIGTECFSSQMNVFFFHFPTLSKYIKLVFLHLFGRPYSLFRMQFNRRDKSTKIKLCVTTLLVHLL